MRISNGVIAVVDVTTDAFEHFGGYVILHISPRSLRVTVYYHYIETQINNIRVLIVSAYTKIISLYIHIFLEREKYRISYTLLIWNSFVLNHNRFLRKK